MTRPERTGRLSRRSFMKLAGIGAAALAVLAGEQLLAQNLAGAVDFPAPLQQIGRGTGRYRQRSWDAAVRLVQDALAEKHPSEVAFLLGPAVDPMIHLVQRLQNGLHWGRVLRWAGLDVSTTLQDAAQYLFGVPALPCFSTSPVGLVISFGVNLSEPWLKGFARQDGGHWIHLGPQRPQFEAEWVPVRPELLRQAALALGRLTMELNGGEALPAFREVDPAAAAAACGVSLDRLYRLADRLWNAPAKVAIPGHLALASANGMAAAQTVLALNAVLCSPGRKVGLFFPPDALNVPTMAPRGNTLAELRAMATSMSAGDVKTLFIYGTNPVRELPQALEFDDALKHVPQVIQFTRSVEGAAPYADWLLPRGVYPSAGILIAAARLAGGNLAEALPFDDEQDFLHTLVHPAPDCHRTASLSGPLQPVPGPVLKRPLLVDPLPPADPTGSFHLLPVSAIPSLEPESAYLNPSDLHMLGLRPGQRARLISTSGEMIAILRSDDGLLPGAVALSAAAAAPLLELSENASGDWAFAATRVRVDEAAL